MNDGVKKQNKLKQKNLAKSMPTILASERETCEPTHMSPLIISLSEAGVLHLLMNALTPALLSFLSSSHRFSSLLLLHF